MVALVERHRTMPVPSWDGGDLPSEPRPDSVQASAWRMPVAVASTGTSPAFGPPIPTVSKQRGFLDSQATAARLRVG